MENNTPKDCPFFEVDEKDQIIFYCTLTEDYINRFFALCVLQTMINVNTIEKRKGIRNELNRCNCNYEWYSPCSLLCRLFSINYKINQRHMV